MQQPVSADSQYQALQSMALPELRQVIRSADYRGHTAGLGRGFLQTNLAIMPQQYALDFMRFCQRNPKPCPLVGVSDTGNPQMFTLGRDLDVRTDAPGYNVYRDGRLTDTLTDITSLWTDDLVAFALGCSFTFEHALMAAGIKLRNIDNNTTVSMYRTQLQTTPAGPFSGGMVVSMRPIQRAAVEKTSQICSTYPLAHGKPVHSGDPGEIGIADIARPDWGDPTPIEEGEVPVFWACGVTPQAVLEQARLPLCITHKPGSMLITDIDEQAEVPVVETD
jgi:uncharacterized protein YcsI (UPF0317 family)